MKNFLNKFKWLILGGVIVFGGSVYAVQITVPSAPLTTLNGSYILQSLGTGQWIASSTATAYFGNYVATSTRTSIFPNASSTAWTSLYASSTVAAFGTLTLTTPLTTAYGGTGLSNPGALGTGALLNFNGSGGATAISAGTAGTAVTSNGSNFVSGTAVAVVGGGTNQSSYPRYSLISSDATGVNLLATSTFPLYLGYVVSTSTGVSVFPYASSTIYASFINASSTNFLGGGLASCSGASNALTYNSSTNFFGCNSISGGTTNYASSSVDWLVYNKGTNVIAYDTQTGVENSYTTADQALNFLINAATTTLPAKTRVAFRPGYYYINASAIISGGANSKAPQFIFEGAGATSTTLVVQTAKGFDFRNQAKVVFRDFGCAMAANGNTCFFASTTQGTATMSSLRESSFENIFGYSTTTGHTGYLFDLVDDFRNTFRNIRGDQMGNCWRSTNNYSNSGFINGDDTFEGFNFCEINNGGVGVAWQVNGVNGNVNQIMFNNINGISNDSGSGSDDIFLKITNGSRVRATGLNVEQFATTTQVISGNGIYVESSKYITATNAVTKKAIFEASATAYNTAFACKEVEVSAATTIFYDKNTQAGQPNSLQGIDGANCVITDNGGSATFSTTTNSVVRDIYNNVSGATWLSDMKIAGGRFFLDQSSGANDYLEYTGGAWRFVANGTEKITLLSTGGYVGFATTTPAGAVVSVASTTQPQLLLTGGVTDAGWAIRSIGNIFYIASTTNLVGFATSSTWGLKIDSNNLTTVNNLALSTTSAGCAAIMSTGQLTSIGTACGAGGGLSSYDAWTHLLFGGALGPNYAATTSQMAISTSTAATNVAALTVASTTKAQLALSAGAGLAQWYFGNSIGNLFIGTTTVTGLSTTTTPALSIMTGTNNVGIGTSTPYAGLSIDSSVIQANPVFVIGSSAGTNLQIATSAQAGLMVGTSSPFSLNPATGATGSQTAPGRVVIATTTTSQISLVGNVTDNAFNIRSIGGALYFATSSSLTQSTSTNSALIIDPNGQVAFPDLPASTAGNAICYAAGNKLVVAGANTCATSSFFTKTNIVSVNGSLDWTNALNLVSYTEIESGKKRYGLIAEEVEKIDPRLVEHATKNITLDGHLFKKGDPVSVDYSGVATLALERANQAMTKVGGEVKRSAEENWQWIVICLLVLWNLYLTFKKKLWMTL